MSCSNRLQPLLLDVMLDDKFYCQLKYDKRGIPEFIDDKIIEFHMSSDIKAFVEEKLPSLKGKKYHIIPTDQKVLR